MTKAGDKKKKRKTKEEAALRSDALPDSLRVQHTHMSCGERMNYHVQPYSERKLPFAFLQMGCDCVSPSQPVLTRAA